MSAESFRKVRKIALKTFMIVTYPIMIPAMLFIYFPLMTAFNCALSGGYEDYKEGQSELCEIMKMAVRIEIN